MLRLWQRFVNYPYTAQFAKWLVALAFGAGITLICLAVAPSYLPPEDAAGLTRYVLLRLVAGIMGILMLSGGALFLNWITPHEWFGMVENGNIACAIVIAALFLALAQIICYA